MKILKNNITVEKNINTFDEGINDKNLFKVVFMAGSGGSGKSFISKLVFGLSKGGVSPFGVKVVNSDTFFERGLVKAGLPKKIDPNNVEVFAKQMAVREVAKQITTKKQEYLIDGMLPLIIDGTGRDYDKIVGQAEMFKQIGYDTSMIFVNTTLEVALERNAKRERTVPEDVVIKAWKNVQSNIGKFQSYFKVFDVIDNSVYFAPGSKEAKEFSNRLFKIGRKHIESPLQNFKGKTIIKLLKETGGKYLHDLKDIQLTNGKK